MKGDLHLHSYYSDGFYSPRDVMQKAKAAGCKIVALTDHDTLDGIPEADEAALKLGIINIHGVEISTFDGIEAHILGYGIDCRSPRFAKFIAEQKERRRVRSVKLLGNLARHGINIPPEMFDFHVKREISRTHIADAMVKLGYEPDFTTAMRKWLRFGTPTFVPTEKTEPKTAIEEIHAAGGLAVLAHPVRIDHLDRYELDAFIRRLALEGLDGIEATYKRSSRSAVKRFKGLAADLGLFTTAGADFHGDGNEIIARNLDCERLWQNIQTD